MSTDPDALCEAVAALLAGIPGVTKIAARPGAPAPWEEVKLPNQSFWEVEVIESPEQQVAALWVREESVVRIDGWFHHSYPDNSARRWRALWRAVKDVLREEHTLGGVVHGGGVPSMQSNGMVSLADRDRVAMVHHCVIEVTYHREFEFQPL